MLEEGNFLYYQNSCYTKHKHNRRIHKSEDIRINSKIKEILHKQYSQRMSEPHAHTGSWNSSYKRNNLTVFCRRWKLRRIIKQMLNEYKYRRPCESRREVIIRKQSKHIIAQLTGSIDCIKCCKHPATKSKYILSYSFYSAPFLCTYQISEQHINHISRTRGNNHIGVILYADNFHHRHSYPSQRKGYVNHIPQIFSMIICLQHKGNYRYRKINHKQRPEKPITALKRWIYKFW